ncbi:MAG: hypothetical protein FJ247_08390 [Nitrospira sp.]|nr:hypothetical protein [Nitrospira sp.]
MTMDARQKSMAAVVLLLAWAGLVVWQWGTWTEPRRVPLTNVTGSADATRTAARRGNRMHVNLERLTSAHDQQQMSFATLRNIFALPSQDGTLPNPADMAAATQPDLTSQSLLQQAVSAELAQYKYLGFVRMGEFPLQRKPIAVLSKNEEVVIGKVGDRVEDHMVLTAVTPESVTIRDTSSGLDQTLPLSEEQPAQQ